MDNGLDSIPRIPASAGALIFDPDGRLLILKPSYKRGWTIPGGQVDPAESPWQACRRETAEECGLLLSGGRLVCVDFRSPGSRRAGGVRFLFDCGAFETADLISIKLQEEEIEDFRFEPLEEAAALLTGPIRRRVTQAAGRDRCIYLEDGRPVPGVA